jgi:Methyltransferase domain
MDDRSLQQFYESHEGKATDKWTIYLRTYDRVFRSYRDSPVRLLEIGIQNGGSLEIWSRYFQDGERFVGCDIDPACAALDYEDPRISVIIGDANEASTRAAVLACSATYDIVIDDGSHRSGDIVKAFANYFPLVADGGMFVAEDLHCSYWQEFDGGLFDPHSSMSFFKHLADIVNQESWGTARSRADLVAGVAAKYGCGVDEALLAQVHSVEFINSVCIVRKQAEADNLLGSRYVAGTVALVAPDNLSVHGLSGRGRPDQSGNPWSTPARPPAEEVVGIREELAGIRKELAEAQATVAARNARIATLEGEIAAGEARREEMNEQHRDQVEALANTLEGMQRSTSWRLTAPVRWFGEQRRRAFAGLGVLTAARRRSGGGGHGSSR